MKLRNKKTGKVLKMQIHNIGGKEYNSLAEINEEWEDYEDVEEEFWYVDTDCETYGVSRAFNQNNSDDVIFNKSIGNYFETREEAEKAVEKLKAWKRLEDEGFRFTDYDYTVYKGIGCGQIFYKENSGDINKIKEDLYLLFGGEDE